MGTRAGAHSHWWRARASGGGAVIRLPFLRFTSRRVTWFSQGMLEKNPHVLLAGGGKGTIVKHPRHSALSTTLPSGNLVKQSLTCWGFISTSWPKEGKGPPAAPPAILAHLWAEDWDLVTRLWLCPSSQPSQHISGLLCSKSRCTRKGYTSQPYYVRSL